MDVSASSSIHGAALEDHPELRIGEVLCGKWKIEQVLGVGAMGAVYGARHNNGSRVAIKILHASLAAHPQLRERFLNEGRAANRVRHRAVTQVFDEGVADDGSFFLVMELLRGQTLDRYQEIGGNLRPLQGLRLAHELLDALIVAHDAGILHRDIKPSNVFLTTEGRVVLLDFGVAQLNETRSATLTGVPIGTPSYMPPEQASGQWQRVDRRSDLWSLGATLFKLLSGRTVREEPTTEEELRTAVSKPAPSLATVCLVPKEVVDIVDRALAFQPEARFPNAASMQEAVRQAMIALGGSVPRSASPSVTDDGQGPWLDPQDLAQLTPARRDGQRDSSIRLKPSSTATVLAASLRPRRARSGVIASVLVLTAAAAIAFSPALDPPAQAASTLPPLVSALRLDSLPNSRGVALRAFRDLHLGVELQPSDAVNGDEDKDEAHREPPRRRHWRRPSARQTTPARAVTANRPAATRTEARATRPASKLSVEASPAPDKAQEKRQASQKPFDPFAQRE